MHFSLTLTNWVQSVLNEDELFIIETHIGDRFDQMLRTESRVSVRVSC